MYTEKDFIGMKFNNVTVLSRNYDKGRQPPYYNCVCDCGRYFVRRKDSIYNPRNKTCGYCQREKHNKTHTRLYNIYKNMIYRCTKTYANSYNEYGGRGITVCGDWEHSYLSFEKWAIENGYQEDLTLDRIDVNGNYEPSNCRWATRKEQSRNLRRNRLVLYNGVKKPLAQWCEELGIKMSSVRKRLEYTDNDLSEAIELPDGFWHNSKKVYMYSKYGEFIKSFNSPTECAKYIADITSYKARNSRIIDVCVGRRKTAYGFIFSYNERW